jgi:hypothetical protein
MIYCNKCSSIVVNNKTIKNHANVKKRGKNIIQKTNI